MKPKAPLPSISCIFSREFKGKKEACWALPAYLWKESPWGLDGPQASFPNLTIKTRDGQAQGRLQASGLWSDPRLPWQCSAPEKRKATASSLDRRPAHSLRPASQSLSQRSSLGGNTRRSSSEPSPGWCLVNWLRSRVAKTQKAGATVPTSQSPPPGLRPSAEKPAIGSAAQPSHRHAATPWHSLEFKGRGWEAGLVQQDLFS